MPEEDQYEKNYKTEFKSKMKKGNVLYQDMPFIDKTTSKQTFKKINSYDKTSLCPPPLEVVTTFTMPDHFLSIKKMDYDYKIRPKCEVEEIRKGIK